MTDIFNNPIDRYKNFNMVHELDIAGTFIYNGIRELNEVGYIKYVGDVFSFLYPIAVGIERLQKVLLVIAEENIIDDIENFEKQLITHSHQELHNRIKKKCKIEFNSRENGFLQILGSFYHSCRYNRFIHTGDIDKEKKLLLHYIEQNIDKEHIYHGFYKDEIFNTEEIKELFGRVIGNISKKYYNEICEVASKQNIYSYEVRSSDSKAAKVFLNQHKKSSLQQQMVDEENVLKEILAFLITNRNDDDNIYKLIDCVEKLDLDMGVVEEHLPEIFKGYISQDLIDHIDAAYSYCDNPLERKKMTKCFFEGYAEIDDI